MKVCSGQKGFTLVELMIAILVAGIIMAIATPSLIGLRRNAEYRDSARAVANMLQDARSTAIRDGGAHIIECDPGTTSCELQRFAYDEADDTWKAETLSSYSFPDNILMRTGAACDKMDVLSIEYFPNGNAGSGLGLADSSVCVTADDASARFKVTLRSFATGKVVIERP